MTQTTLSPDLHSTYPRIHPVIHCGGAGTRLWPLSRKSFPKQFARLMGEKSLFQSSVRRVAAAGNAAPLVITGEPIGFIVTEQLAAIEVDALAQLIEPQGRNTAPAVPAAVLWLAKRDPDAVMLITPSDHVIPDAHAFRAAVQAARPRALAGDLITFGIAPVRAETGYGWLELAATTPQSLARAESMPVADNLMWNAGIFLFTARTVLAAYRASAPQLMAGAEATSDLGFTRLAADPWAQLDDISIAYAIMERTGNLAVMPFSAGWSDLGGWDAVWLESGLDGAGNVTSDRTTAIDCSGTLVRSESPKVEQVGIGLQDIIVVAMNDAVLVAPKSEARRVKEAVSALKSRSAKQATEFSVDDLPWSWFEGRVIGEWFPVKRIVVKPGATLSLQSHHHRSEHWVVAQGTARVTIDQDARLISENQSVYIRIVAIHRIENPGKVPMVLIEVQTGSYLGDDDIIRHEDVYARN